MRVGRHGRLGPREVLRAHEVAVAARGGEQRVGDRRPQRLPERGVGITARGAQEWQAVGRHGHERVELGEHGANGRRRRGVPGRKPGPKNRDLPVQLPPGAAPAREGGGAGRGRAHGLEAGVDRPGGRPAQAGVDGPELDAADALDPSRFEQFPELGVGDLVGRAGQPLGGNGPDGHPKAVLELVPAAHRRRPEVGEPVRRGAGHAPESGRVGEGRRVAVHVRVGQRDRVGDPCDVGEGMAHRGRGGRGRLRGARRGAPEGEGRQDARHPPSRTNPRGTPLR